MAKGRKPIPTAIKALRGNPGKRPLNDREPRPAGVPTCPDHLDDEARAEWARIAPSLDACGVLSGVDRAALAAYCQMWSRWVAAERAVAKGGAIIKTANGNEVQSPHLAVANKAVVLMHKMLIEFGMTPSSRAKLVISDADGDDLDTFLGETFKLHGANTRTA